MEADPERPRGPMLFSIARPAVRHPADTRSAGVMLLVVAGLGAATVSFFWERRNIERIHTVEVGWHPEAAAAAEAAMQAEVEAAAKPEAAAP